MLGSKKNPCASEDEIFRAMLGKKDCELYVFNSVRYISIILAMQLVNRNIKLIDVEKWG